MTITAATDARDNATCVHRPTAVIVSRQRIIGATNGSSAYLLAVARTLKASGFNVDLVQPSPLIAGRTPIMRLLPDLALFRHHRIRGGWRAGSTVIFSQPMIWWSGLIGACRSILRRMGICGAWVADRPAPYAVATPWTDADLRFAAKHIPGDTALVIADYVFVTPVFAVIPAGARTAILMHDLFHARDGKGADSVAMITRDQEIALLGTADAVLAIQAEECEFIQQHVPSTNAVLVPMPATPVDKPQPGDAEMVLFVGSMTAPNSVGLQWFLDEIWPTIRAARPSVTLCVTGTVCRAFSDPVEGVEFAGLVPELESYYRRAAVVISPLTFGSGLKIKLIEAMAAGKAIVATSISLQGVEAICEPALRRADEPAQFADAVVALLDDAGSRLHLGQSALDVVANHFAVGPCHQDLREWLASDWVADAT